MTDRVDAQGADPVDVHLGAKLREIRLLFQMTQRELAGIVGVNHQQIHRYEHAHERMNASTLGVIADELDIPVGVFFFELAEPKPTSLTFWEQIDPEIRQAAMRRFNSRAAA